jgi:hypothetical protein
MCGRIIYIEREREDVVVCTFVRSYPCVFTRILKPHARFLNIASSSSHSFYFCVLLLVVAGFGGRKTKRTDW